VRGRVILWRGEGVGECICTALSLFLSLSLSLLTLYLLSLNSILHPMKKHTLPVNYIPTDTVLNWSYWREPSVYGNGSRSACWAWQDDEGYVRLGPPTLDQFRVYIRGYFESYAVKPLVDI
jgi:hypothetical protein